MQAVAAEFSGDAGKLACKRLFNGFLTRNVRVDSRRV
jgi:hypothetical protein